MPLQDLPDPRKLSSGLPGKAVLVDRLEHALARRDSDPASPTRLAVLCVGLDTYNQAVGGFGYGADSALPAELAPRLTQELRPGDTVAQLGEDTLAVLCESLADEAGAVSVAERILKSVGEPVTVAGSSQLVIASVGIVV